MSERHIVPLAVKQSKPHCANGFRQGTIGFTEFLTFVNSGKHLEMAASLLFYTASHVHKEGKTNASHQSENVKGSSEFSNGI